MVTVRGDIDAAGMPVLRKQLADAVGRASNQITRDLVIDVSRVSHCTIAGLALFIDIQRRVRALGGSMALFGPQLQLTRLMRTTGLDRRLTVRPTNTAMGME